MPKKLKPIRLLHSFTEPTEVVISPYPSINTNNITNSDTRLSGKTKLLLMIFLFTFLTMIAGVVFFEWWLLEMTALFLASSVLLAIILRLNESVYIKQFITGAESLLL